jgi:hypothetical protein
MVVADRFDQDMEARVLYTMRLSLPDKPGTLGSIATSISHVPASIVTMRVVEHDGDHAVDELVVSAEGASPEKLRDAAQAIPGVVVECVRRVATEPDPLAALELADKLMRGIGAPLQSLVDGLPEAMPAAFAMAFDVQDELTLLATSPGAPVPGMLETPWLPLDCARRLHFGEWMPQRWRMARFELAAVPLGSPTSFVVVGRWPGMRFRPGELRQLDILTGMALRAPRASYEAAV